MSREIQSFSEKELWDIRDETDKELKHRAFDNLSVVADQYVALYGDKAGIEQMAEDLCRIIAPDKHPGGWAGLVRAIVKFSG
ncbi:TPA: hypothetical protein JG930_004375 [Enterobacter hormaechei subsp. steigerwaltii]|nr:hypothetical protein [Enterobacter hormaechei subsp. steigerwaltii]